MGFSGYTGVEGEEAKSQHPKHKHSDSVKEDRDENYKKQKEKLNERNTGIYSFAPSFI